MLESDLWPLGQFAWSAVLLILKQLGLNNLCPMLTSNAFQKTLGCVGRQLYHSFLSEDSLLVFLTHAQTICNLLVQTDCVYLLKSAYLS